jgi:glycosyltransferase involved in cell wall biosynthesis
MISKNYAYKIYICNDEFPRMQKGHHKANPIKRAIRTMIFQSYENIVAKHSDRCFTPHYLLRNKLRKVNKKVDMLMHAHNYHICIESAPKTENIKVGFAGFIDWRLKVDWLKKVVKDPNMQLTLIGPIKGEKLEELCRHPDVKYISTLPEKNLINEIRKMDVLIMPYDERDNAVYALTTNSKTFQYISACRPIVISNLPNYIEMPPGIFYKAKSTVEFLTKINLAYREDCYSLTKLRADIALQNTWNKRGELLYSFLKPEINKSVDTAIRVS